MTAYGIGQHFTVPLEKPSCKNASPSGREELFLHSFGGFPKQALRIDEPILKRALSHLRINLAADAGSEPDCCK